MQQFFHGTFFQMYVTFQKLPFVVTLITFFETPKSRLKWNYEKCNTKK